MEIKRDRMVFLGYGKYWRSDAIVGLMPIEDERGPGRRTNVFVAGGGEPIGPPRPPESIPRDKGAAGGALHSHAPPAAGGGPLAPLPQFSPVVRPAPLAPQS